MPSNPSSSSPQREPQGSPPTGTPREPFTTAAHWLVFIVRSIAFSLEVILHERFGVRYVDLRAAAVIAITLVYSLFWPGRDLGPMLAFLAFFLANCLLVRVGMLDPRRRRQAVHSYYSGRPLLSRLLPRLREHTVKGLIEPLLVFLAGVVILPRDEPLGAYLLIASFCLMASVQVAIAHERVCALDLYDAVIDQRHLAERFRQMRSGR